MNYKPDQQKIITDAIKFISSKDILSLSELISMGLIDAINNDCLAAGAILASDHNCTDFIAQLCDYSRAISADPEIKPDINSNTLSILSQASEISHKILRKSKLIKRKNSIAIWKCKDGSIIEIDEVLCEPLGWFNNKQEWSQSQ